MPEKASEVILELVGVGLEGLAEDGEVFLVVNLSEWENVQWCVWRGSTSFGWFGRRRRRG